MAAESSARRVSICVSRDMIFLNSDKCGG